MAKISRILFLVTVMAAGMLHANPVLVTSVGALGPNDSVNWSQLGADGTIIGPSLSATSANSLAITGSLAGVDGCLAVVGGFNCSWAAGPGFLAGNSVIWAEDDTPNFAGSGPLTLGFPSVLGAGAYIQANAIGAFTARIEAFNGNVSLGQFTEASANGDGIFIGVLDSVSDITSIKLSLASCTTGNNLPDCSDFAVNTLQLAEQVATPEPASMLLLGTGLMGLISRFRKSNR